MPFSDTFGFYSRQKGGVWGVGGGGGGAHFERLSSK